MYTQCSEYWIRALAVPCYILLLRTGNIVLGGIISPQKAVGYCQEAMVFIKSQYYILNAMAEAWHELVTWRAQLKAAVSDVQTSFGPWWARSVLRCYYELFCVVILILFWACFWPLWPVYYIFLSGVDPPFFY